MWYYRGCEAPYNMKPYACNEARKLKEKNEGKL